MAAKAKPLGRYNFVHVRDPAGGIAPQPPSELVRKRIGRPPETEVVAVLDAGDNPDGAGRILARSRRDLLGDELSKERISLEAYNVGRIIEALFERANGHIGSSSAWLEQSGRLDPCTASRIAIIRKLVRARETVSYVDGMARVLGRIDTRIVKQFLGDRLSAEQVATLRGRSGERAANYYLERLRDALKSLVDAGWAGARGKERSATRVAKIPLDPTGEQV